MSSKSILNSCPILIGDSPNLTTKLLNPSDDLLRPTKAKAECGEQPGDYEQ